MPPADVSTVGDVTGAARSWTYEYTDHGDTPFNPHSDLNRKHLDVRGCWGSDYSHFHRVVDVLRTPAAQKWRAVTLRRYPLSKMNEALEEVAAARSIKALVDPQA